MTDFSVTHIIYAIGVLTFGVWLLRTSFGRNALTDSQLRRNNMPIFMPFVVLLIWASATSIAISITQKVSSDAASWQSVLLENLVISFSYLLAIVSALLIARAYFPRRLKGFGLNIKTIISDFFT